MIKSPQIKNKTSTLGRVGVVISNSQYTDVNLYGKLYKNSITITVGDWKNFTFKDVQQQNFSPIQIGEKFGPLWSIHWFRLSFEIPTDWMNGKIYLIWDCSGESLIYSYDGKPLQGLTSEYDGKNEILLNFSSESCLFYIEVSCNKILSSSNSSLIDPPDNESLYELKKVQICLLDSLMHSVYSDLTLLLDISKHFPENDSRTYEALHTANQMINFFHDNSLLNAKLTADKFFNARNGSSSHTFAMIGHCHIDCAWLWPLDETIRKCARSWATVVRLMESYPDFIFAASQAQQFYWIKIYFPILYENIKFYVMQNRFIAVGGSWVEMDVNLPSGESLMRQFLYGQNFFFNEFEKICTECWLPDSFGYSPQIPQILGNFGISRFMSTKLSWNLINKFPHNNFIWRGVDNSCVIVHFPPGNSYGMQCRPEEFLNSVNNLKDKGRFNTSIFLYGFGDGGGGPNARMLESIERLKDCDKISKLVNITPCQFFKELEDSSANLMTWYGELYLELHNATYTSQCWYKVLLNQFHDILPGTCIRMVIEEAECCFKNVLDSLQEIKNLCLKCLFGDNASNDSKYILVNALPWLRKEVIALNVETANNLSENDYQIVSEKELMALVSVTSMGYEMLSVVSTSEYVEMIKNTDDIVLRNSILTAIIDHFGRVKSIKLHNHNKECIIKGKFGNQLLLFDDMPFYWEAWDVIDCHLETRKELNGNNKMEHKCDVLHWGPLFASVRWELKFGNSILNQVISLKALSPFLEFDTEINWQENRKLLKVEFPINVTSAFANYEMQFCHFSRPTHRNTSWDWAKFEVCGHRWADLSEYGFGVAVLNDCKYGWSCYGSFLCLSLLRAPKKPDPLCDIGHHSFKYAVMPHLGSLQEAEVIHKAYEFNHPIRIYKGNFEHSHWSSVNISNAAVILETMKLAENSTSDLILRLYESFGSSLQIQLQFGFDLACVYLCNGMEEHLTQIPIIDNKVSLNFSSFEIKNLRCCTCELSLSKVMKNDKIIN